MERTDELVLHRLLESDVIGYVVVEQAVDIIIISPVWGGSHTEQELRLEMVDYRLIGRGTRMMYLVDQDVLEGVRGNPAQNIGFGQCLNSDECAVGSEVVDRGIILLDRLRHDLREALHALPQDWEPVNDVQELHLGLPGVKCGEIRLSRTCGRDHKCPVSAFRPYPFDRFQGLFLHPVGLGPSAVT